MSSPINIRNREREKQPNRWVFGKPEPTADYITEIWGLKRWTGQQRATKGDIIFDGCFFYAVKGQGLCALLHPEFDEIVFKVPPFGFYRYIGTRTAEKREVEKIIEDAGFKVRSEIKNIMHDYSVDDLSGMSSMGRGIVEREIERRIEKITTDSKLRIRRLS
jgi:hypothetical protein